MSSNVGVFFLDAQVPTLGVFNAFLWIVIILRVRTLHISNREFPSRWRTASAVFIILTGVLSLVHLAIWASAVVLNKRTGRILPPIWSSPEKWQEVHPTPEQWHMIISAFNWLSAGIWGSRIILANALWISKIAFLLSFMATAYCLSKRLRISLYVVIGLVTLTLALELFFWLWQLSYDPFESWTPEIVIASETNTIYYVFNEPKWELTVTGLNVFSDLLMIGIAVAIVRSLEVSTRSIWLLGIMLFLTTATAITRFALFLDYFGITAPLTATIQTDQEGAAVVVLSELEVLLGGFLSCVPAVRAWARARKGSRKQVDAAGLAPPGESDSMKSSEVKDEEESLEFLTEPEGHRNS